MPLLDHFHPPLKGERQWQSFHSRWASALADHLNVLRLPQGYFAEIQYKLGTHIEVDVGTVELARGTNGPPTSAKGEGGTAVLVAPPYAPPEPTITFPAVFSDEFAVLVYQDLGGPTLVGAIELVSPANKDRPDTRRAFAIKCAGYLQKGVGLVIIDIVTERLANLHDELVTLLQLSPSCNFATKPALYATSYRPIRRAEENQIDAWLCPLAVGGALPHVPLALRGLGCVELDLDGTYGETRSKLRLG